MSEPIEGKIVSSAPDQSAAGLPAADWSEAFRCAVAEDECRDAAAENIHDAFAAVSDAENAIAACEAIAAAAASENAASQQTVYNDPAAADAAKSAARQRAGEARSALERAAAAADAAQDALGIAETALSYLKHQKSAADAADQAISDGLAGDAENNETAKAPAAVDRRLYDSLVSQFDSALEAHTQARRSAAAFDRRLNALKQTVQTALDAADREFSFVTPDESAKINAKLLKSAVEAAGSAVPLPGDAAAASGDSFARTFAAALASAAADGGKTVEIVDAYVPLSAGSEAGETSPADAASGQSARRGGIIGTFSLLFRHKKDDKDKEKG